MTDKRHYTVTTDQDVIDAIQRNGTTDPRGIPRRLLSEIDC